MKSPLPSLLVSAVLCAASHGAEYFVATTGDDAYPGSADQPLRTIQRAADLAQPGDTITVKEGIYREWVKPPRGGESDARRIVYRAAPGERVVLKGSEPLGGWTRVDGDVWTATVSNTLFGDFNPYRETIDGVWFDAMGRQHHPGAVYLDGEWLAEAATRDGLFTPGSPAQWFGEAGAEQTTLWARFPGVDPNARSVEINVRKAVFFPAQTGIGFITVRGFVMRDAASTWAPPTSHQTGLIGPNWSKGWIIENNTISHSACVGISLGKYADPRDAELGSHDGYFTTIELARQNGWQRGTVGHHIVRHNRIHLCGQAGIAGSFGGAFSEIYGNHIHDIYFRRTFGGQEMAGIKLHGPVDTVIRDNHIHHCWRGIWLDWMTQGTRVSGNLLHNNENTIPAPGDVTHGADLFLEVNHGPTLVDHNVMLSPMALWVMSQGTAFAHNLFGGHVKIQPDLWARQTPFLAVHSTAGAGMHPSPCGDDRYFHNLFLYPLDLAAQINPLALPSTGGGNVYAPGSQPFAGDASPLVLAAAPTLNFAIKPEGALLTLNLNADVAGGHSRAVVTSSLLGSAAISGQRFENPDQSALSLERDYFGKPRDPAAVTPGPFQALPLASERLWPKWIQRADTAGPRWSRGVGGDQFPKP
jgi:alpha-N-arabinofuranosidase